MPPELVDLLRSVLSVRVQEAPAFLDLRIYEPLVHAQEDVSLVSVASQVPVGRARRRRLPPRSL